MTHPGSRAEADLKMWKEFSRKDKMLYTLENRMLLDSSIGNCWVWVPYSERVFYSISAEGIHGINVDIFTNFDRNVIIDAMELIKGQVLAPLVRR